MRTLGCQESAAEASDSTLVRALIVAVMHLIFVLGVLNIYFRIISGSDQSGVVSMGAS